MNDDIFDTNITNLLQRSFQPEQPTPEFVQQLKDRMKQQALPRRSVVGFVSRHADAFRLLAAAAVLLAVVVGVQQMAPKSKPRSGPQAAAGQSTPWPREGLTARARPPQIKLAHLAVGDAARTGAHEKRRLELADGSIIALNENTRVTLRDEQLLRLDEGEVFVEVSPRRPADSGRMLVVQTATRKVAAKGTKFAVRQERQGTHVAVVQGRVEVSGGTDRKFVDAGEELAAGSDALVRGRRGSHVLEWTRELAEATESPLVPASQFGGGALVAIDPEGQESRLDLRRFHIDVHIEDGFARTTIDQTYFNRENRRLEGTFYFPLPADASLSRLAMYVDGKRMEGGMAERDHARNVYETILHTQRDPALLEWVDGTTFKMRVFPLEARQEKRIVLSYTQRLPSVYGSAAYRFPAGHSLPIVRDWSFKAFVKGGAPRSWSSDSHEMAAKKQGDDLVLSAQGQNVTPNRDVVLKLEEADTPADRAVFSTCTHDGAKYLMIRFRPSWEAEADKKEKTRQASEANRARPPRNWIVIFESSADRDPVLARTQIEIVRHLLSNVEHSDRFTMLSVGTSVQELSPSLLQATTDNIEAGVDFLEHSHLIGALNLGQAFDAAKKFLVPGTETYLVHVGSGNGTMGERRPAELVKRIPAGARYVGVGVGKRWARGFMKSAAERTGGYFTQINPDEPIAWRSFDLLAMLNSPRLLNVVVEDLDGKWSFLTFVTMLASGDELCAVARVDSAQAEFPQTVAISGDIDDGRWERRFAVTDVAAPADYLPRTWAKLEIDRLVAEDATKHKDRITALSKAMYVMSPFTSLLVLENEAMYAQYKVDRGRKDHWALYPCPDTIPVVHEPLTPAADPSPGDGDGRSVEQVLRTIVFRSAPAILKWPEPEAAGRDLERSTRLNERLRLTELAVEGMARFNDSLDFSFPVPQQVTAANWDMNNLWYAPAQGLVVNRDMDRYWKIRAGVSQGRVNLNSVEFETLGERTVALQQQGMEAPFLAYRATNPSLYTNYFSIVPQNPYAQVGEVKINGNEVTRQQVIRHMLQSNPQWLNELNSGNGRVSTVDLTMLLSKQLDNADAVRLIVAGQDERIPNDIWKQIYGEPILSKLRFGESDRKMRRPDDDRTVAAISLPEIEPILIDDIFAALARASREKGRIRTTSEGLAKQTIPAGQLDFLLAIFRSQLQMYQPPSYTDDDRIFFDLISYAPGMNTTSTDVEAVLSAEAKLKVPARVGQIDPAAGKLIDRAREQGWMAVTIPAGTSATSYAIMFDGRGRFSYERVLPNSLRERVVCDGDEMVHLYPELGVGARRTVSRFHRAEFGRLIPWVVPPVEDLALAGDVRLSAENTIEIAPAAKPEAAKAERILQLVFAESGRLQERRVLAGDTRKVIVREIYEADGAIRLVITKDGKEETTARQLKIQKATAPDLHPDRSAYVILPLPYRSLEHVRAQLKLKDGSYGRLSAEQALRHFAAAFAVGNAAEAWQIFDRNFIAKRTWPIGFYTLLAACGHNVDPEQLYSHGSYTAQADPASMILNARGRMQNVLLVHPQAPLARYLAYFSNADERKREPRGAIGDDSTPLSSYLARFRFWHKRFSTNKVRTGSAQDRQAELQFALGLIKQQPESLLSWVLLSALDDPDRLAKDGIIAAHDSFAQIPELRFAAEYQRARKLLAYGAKSVARECFVQLMKEVLNAGATPVFDRAFFEALHEESSNDPWAVWIRQAAEKLLKKDRPLNAVVLAWRVWQLGDEPLAEELLDSADRRAVQPGHRLIVNLAAADVYEKMGKTAPALALVQALVAEEQFADIASLWRLAGKLTGARENKEAVVPFLEKALDLEFAHLPKVIDLKPVREEYGSLMSHYQQMAAAMAGLKITPPADFVPRVVRCADRWRAMDAEQTASICQSAARIFKLLGQPDLAWQYLTTPIALRPADSSPWLTMAQTLSSEGEWRLADHAYVAAFDAEATNAQILWDRARNLELFGQTGEAKRVYEQLAAGSWQPRFAWLQEQARQKK